MSNELKPCPFCGAKPLMYDLLDTHGGFSIECPTDGCDAEKMKRTKEAAISAWNTRAPAGDAETYRLALHEIAEEWAGAECGEPVTAQEAYAIELAHRMYRLAVAAQKQQEDKQ